MTASASERSETHAVGGVGRISRIIGPVVDVEFPADGMPEQYNPLTTEVELGGDKRHLNLEVAQHIGDNMVRAISMQPTDGLVRGTPVRTPAARSPCRSATSPWARSSTRPASS